MRGGRREVPRFLTLVSPGEEVLVFEIFVQQALCSMQKYNEYVA